MSTPLLQRTHLAATFQPGKSAVGHHWDLVDPDAADAVLGRSKRVYKSLLSRTITATGLDQGRDLRADVFDGKDKVAQVVSEWTREPRTWTVTLTDSGGRLVGTTDHDRETDRLRLLDPAGTELGHVALTEAEPWEVLDAAGGRVAVLTSQAFAFTPYSLIDDLVFDHGGNELARDFQATFHLGVRGCKRYEVIVEPQAVIAEPLRTLVVLLPVLAAYSY